MGDVPQQEDSKVEDVERRDLLPCLRRDLVDGLGEWDVQMKQSN
jgi:hypothetical protein